MRLVILMPALLLPACTPAIEAELRVIEQSKKGVQLVRQSIDQRQEWIDQQHIKQRDALDAAFDADVEARAAALTSDWVIEARKAYITAARALEASRLRAQQSADVDRANLDAIDECLIQLQALNRAQLDAIAPIRERLK